MTLRDLDLDRLPDSDRLALRLLIASPFNALFSRSACAAACAGSLYE
jgi:hypothetical protein